MEKLLTIVIPSYNMEKLLPKCIESVLVEDKVLLDLLDIIVVNDGSTDGTSAIGHRYAALHPNSVRVVDKENGHHGSCVNCGLKMARGRFIRILDADDYFDKAAFARYLSKLAYISSDNSCIDAVITPYKRVSSDDAEMAAANYELPKDKVLDSRNIFDVVRTAVLPSLTYSTEMLRSIDYRQTEGIAYSDTEWYYSPLAAVKKCVYIDEYVYNYFIGREGQSVSVSESIKNFNDLCLLLQNMAELYKGIKRDCRFDGATLLDGLHRLMCNMFGFSIRYQFIGLTRRYICKTLDTIRQCSPELESIAMSTVVSRIFHFRYVKFIDQHPKLSLPYIIMVRYYLRIASLITKIQNRCCMGAC